MKSLFNRYASPRRVKFNGDISDWDVSRVTNMADTFGYTSSFNGDLSKWDVSSVSNMLGMFTSASLFNGDLSKWDVSSVTTMERMFQQASSFNGDLSRWDVSSVTTMYRMFANASSFNADISKWDVSMVTTMVEMFFGASSFAWKLCGAWSTSTANKEGMFRKIQICTTMMSVSTSTTTSNSKDASMNTLQLILNNPYACDTKCRDVPTSSQTFIPTLDVIEKIRSALF